MEQTTDHQGVPAGVGTGGVHEDTRTERSPKCPADGYQTHDPLSRKQAGTQGLIWGKEPVQDRHAPARTEGTQEAMPARCDHRACGREPGHVPVGDQGTCRTRALGQPQAASESCAQNTPRFLVYCTRGSDHPRPASKALFTVRQNAKGGGPHRKGIELLLTSTLKCSFYNRLLGIFWRLGISTVAICPSPKTNLKAQACRFWEGQSRSC